MPYKGLGECVTMANVEICVNIGRYDDTEESVFLFALQMWAEGEEEKDGGW